MRQRALVDYLRILSRPMIRLAGGTRSRWSASAVVADGWSPAGGTVLAVAAHPDDEVIGCGGTLARHAAAGDPVTVVYLTSGGGSAGHPWLSTEERERTREREARDGCGVLGVHDLHFLRAADGRLDSLEAGGQLEASMVEILRKLRPRLVYAPHGLDNHADHRAAHRITLSALERTFATDLCAVQTYEIWSPLQADRVVDITHVMRVKLRAIRCHRLALDAFDCVSIIRSLGAYRAGSLLKRHGFAEAFATIKRL